MGRNKLKVGKWKSNLFTKTKKILVKIPLPYHLKIKNELLKKYDLKGFQSIFDYLVIGGVLYLNHDIISIVNEKLPFYVERNKQAKLARLGKVEKPEYPEYHRINFMLFAKDAKALNDFVIEKNCAKQWLVEILFTEFANENQIVIDFIKRGQKHNVLKRKKQIARLAEDKWIKILPRDESKLILKQLTENYEKRKFDSNIQIEIDKLIEEKRKQLEKEGEEENELNKKIASVRAARQAEIQKIVAPIPEND